MGSRFRSVRYAVFALASLGLFSCRTPRTQLVVRVDTDMPQGPGQLLTAVRVIVQSQGESTPRRSEVLRLRVPTDRNVTLPADVLGISPRDNDASRVVTVTVEALRPTGASFETLFSTAATTSFIANETRVLPLFLADHCRFDAAMCGTGQTCGRSGCEPIARPAQTLPVWAPDGGVADGSTDAGALDGPVADAPSPDTRDDASSIDAPADGPSAEGGCVSPEILCSGSCIDPATSSAHCGACDRVCPPANADGTCSSGACRFTCRAGYGDCDGNAANGCETNLDSSPMNCGVCGRACTGGAVCASGSCSDRCATGQLMCGALCVNTQTDVMHCGACGNSCALPNAATSTCRDGACRIEVCRGGFADCDSNPTNGCESSLASVASCGRCGASCSAAGGTPACVDGACRPTCNTGFADCDGDGANGCETATSSNALHCGACGNACPSTHGTASCARGACAIACDPGFADCDGNAANGCETATTTSAMHCGRCGNACMAGFNCAMGSCVDSCPAGTTTCGSSCVNTQSDAMHCGACGRVCTPPNAEGACSAGTCRVGRCSPGFADCDGNPANGCEVDSTTDAAHCGACGRVCASTNAVATCSASTCSLACSDGYGDCDRNAANGCEQPLNTTMNCGACGTVCPGGARATATCTPMRTCALSCNAGYGDCNADAADGCETPTTTVMNCGACGRPCAPANATGSCAGAGTCQVAMCNAGFGNCNADATDGCETPTTSDTNHCGVCNRRCTPPANATAVCAMGTCDFVCSPGYMRSGTQCVGIVARPLAPLSGTVLSSRRVTLRWQNAAGATGARIELCSQLECASAGAVVSAMDVTGESATITVPAGASFWHLRLLGDAARSGPAGPVWVLLARGGTSVDARALALSFVGTSGSLSAANYNGAGFVARNPQSSWARVDGIDPSCSGSSVSVYDSTSSAGYAVAVVGLGASGQGSSIVANGAPLRAPRGAVQLYQSLSTGSAPTCNLQFDREIAAPASATEFGIDVVALGDNNRDGYADFGVLGRDASTRALTLWIFRGSATGFGDTPSQALTLSGAGGTLVPSFSAGDVNGDDYWDLVVGHGSTANNAGSVRVFHGSATGLASMPSSTLASPIAAGAPRFGAAVSVHGDLNGDGIADLLVGAPGASLAGQTESGAAWTYFGSPAGIVEPSARAVATTPAAHARFGEALTLVPDLNGDGNGDAVIGAPGASDGFGEAYAYFGDGTTLEAMPSQTFSRGDFAQYGSSVSLAPPAGASQFDRVLVGQRTGLAGNPGVESLQGSSTGVMALGRLFYPLAQTNTHFSASAVGDFDGDGRRDVALASASNLFVYRDAGASALRAPVSTSLCAQLIRSLVAIDINRDGLDDLVAGAEGSVLGGNLCVFLSTPNGVPMLPAQTLVNPDAESSSAFGTVMVAADFNGDGHGDVAVGAPWGGAYAGRAYVFTGTATGLRSSPTRLTGIAGTNAQLGASLAVVPDNNGDALPELAIGMPGFPVPSRGTIRIYQGAMGSAQGITTPAAQEIIETLDYRAIGNALASRDFNGDRRPELVTTRLGELAVYPGVAGGGFSTTALMLALPAGVTRTGTTRLSPTGDVDGDMLEDIAVSGLTDGAQAGVVVLYRGTASGLATVQTQVLRAPFTDAGRRFGADSATVLGLGDLNGDMLGDLLVSAAPLASMPGCWWFSGQASAPAGLRASPTGFFHDGRSVLWGAGVYGAH